MPTLPSSPLPISLKKPSLVGKKNVLVQALGLPNPAPICISLLPQLSLYGQILTEISRLFYNRGRGTPDPALAEETN